MYFCRGSGLCDGVVGLEKSRAMVWCFWRGRDSTAVTLQKHGPVPTPTTDTWRKTDITLRCVQLVRFLQTSCNLSCSYFHSLSEQQCIVKMETITASRPWSLRRQFSTAHRIFVTYRMQLGDFHASHRYPTAIPRMLAPQFAQNFLQLFFWKSHSNSVFWC